MLIPRADVNPALDLYSVERIRGWNPYS